MRPLQITPDSGDVVLLPSNYLSVVWGQAALDGVKEAALSRVTVAISQDQQIQELLKLKKLSDEAKLTAGWTGVLPKNTPTWSQGAEFLADWPVDLLP